MCCCISWCHQKDQACRRERVASLNWAVSYVKPASCRFHVNHVWGNSALRSDGDGADCCLHLRCWAVVRILIFFLIFLDKRAAFWITFSRNSTGRCWRICGRWSFQGGRVLLLITSWSSWRKWFSCWRVISRKDWRWPRSRRESALSRISAAAGSWIIRKSGAIRCTCQR